MAEEKKRMSSSFSARSAALKQSNVSIFRENFLHLREEKLEACFTCFIVHKDVNFSPQKKNRGKLLITDEHLLYYVFGKRNHGFKVEISWNLVISVQLSEVHSNIFNHKSIQIKTNEGSNNEYHFIEFTKGLKTAYQFLNNFHIDYQNKIEETKRRSSTLNNLFSDYSFPLSLNNQLNHSDYNYHFHQEKNDSENDNNENNINCDILKDRGKVNPSNPAINSDPFNSISLL